MKFQVAKAMIARTSVAETSPGPRSLAVTALVVAGIAVGTGTTALADARRPHDAHLAQTSAYGPIEGFSRVVGGERFTGFFTAVHGACSVSLIVSRAGDDALRTPPQRLQIELGPTQVADIAANERQALGIACSVDADSLKVATLARMRTRTVARD